MNGPEVPYVVNPESVGDPNETPVVRVTPGLAAIFAALVRCPERDVTQNYHRKSCSFAGDNIADDEVWS